MKNVKTETINGRTYTIQCHPFNEGAVIAFELGRAIRSHMLASQKPTMKAMNDLNAEEKARIEAAKDDEERNKLWQEIVMPKIDQSQILDSAVSFLQGMDSNKMAALTNDLFKYVKDYNPVLGVPYKDVIPLIKAVVEQNDFLDLDASDLLQALA